MSENSTMTFQQSVNELASALHVEPTWMENSNKQKYFASLKLGHVSVWARARGVGNSEITVECYNIDAIPSSLFSFGKLSLPGDVPISDVANLVLALKEATNTFNIERNHKGL